MSMVEWLRKKNPGAEVTRPENIYQEEQGFHIVKKWHEWECVAIIRDPVKRIQSGIKYFSIFHNMPIEKIINNPWDGVKKYENVGFRWPIQQSDYDYYIKKWQKTHASKVKVYRFEDMIKDKDFPHINESEFKRKFTKKETDLIKERLETAGISY